MPIRDPGPVYNLGYAVNSKTVNHIDEEERQGVNPNSGIIAKQLHGNPVMRFFAVSAATMVGMAVGGKYIRKGGVKLAQRLQDSNAAWATNSIGNYRKVQKQLDAWQGVTRTFADESDHLKLFVEGADGKTRGDHVEELNGFFFTKTEREKAARLGYESSAEWTIKHELQQKLVKQARRLPYELPAAYAVQRGITDTVFGEHDDSRSQVNWKNPVDVFTDFVTQSVTNTAFMIAPFEVGTAGARQGWRKMMTYGDDMVNLSPGQQEMRNASVSIRAVLGQVGVDATDLLNKTAKLGSQTSGSFAAGLNAAREESTGLVQFMHKMRSGSLTYSEKLDQQRLTKAGKVLRSQEILNIGPGPFTGMGAGVKAGRDSWRDIGAGHDALMKMMNVGRSRFFADGGSTAAERDAMRQFIGRGSHPIEELAGRVRDLSGRGSKSGWSHSEFNRGQIQNEYQKVLNRKLKQLGVEDKAADKFTSRVAISPSNDLENLPSFSDRIRISGGGKLLGDTQDEIFDDLYLNLGMLGEAGAKSVRNRLPEAIRSADDIFSNQKFRARLDKKITGQWNNFEKTLLPDVASDVFRMGKLPYEDFAGALSSHQRTFLLRKTASLTGLEMTDAASGKAVTDAAARARLRDIGMDPSDTDQMRAYLTTKGAMAKPWTRQGRNAFGLRPMHVSDALDRGYFSQGKDTETEIKRLSARITKNNPIGTSQRLSVGGMYESASGSVIDFTPLKRGVTRSLDMIASEFHVPLVKFNPLRLFGYSARMEARENSVLQYIPSMSNQAFLKGSNQSDDFYMWMRNKGISNKGRVFAFGGDKHRTLDGQYTAQSSVGGWHARNARLAIGESGLNPKLTPESETVRPATRLSRIKKAFNVSDDQPDSIFGYVSRFIKRKEDLNNPLTFAKLLARGEIETKRGTLRIGDLNASTMAEHFDEFSTGLRKFGFSDRVINTTFGNLTKYNLRGKNAPQTFGLAKDGTVDVSKLKTSAQVNEFLELALAKERDSLASLPENMRAPMRRAQEALLGRHVKSANSPSYFDKQLPQISRSATVNTRLDRAKQDIYRYMSMRNAARKGESLDEAMPDYLAHLQKQKSKGAISKSEYTEARTALLSMQIEQQAFAGFRTGLSHQARSNSIVRNLLSDTPAGGAARNVLEDISRGDIGLSSGRYGLVQPVLKQKFGIAKHKYSGTTHNPFGNNTILVPTFGTVWGRNPMQAIMAAAGINTWSNPGAYSAASIPASHLFERMNRFFSVSGLQLNANKYAGPLDFYARGVVGQRVLPAVAGATGLMTVDRTIGGAVNDKDQNGDRVYSPFFVGIGADAVAKGQVGLAGLIPGGQTSEEKSEELYEGEVAVRSGRWWPLGNTPMRGGRIDYFRPSWYQRLKSGALYQDQTHGTPIERALFGHDFSPLRPLDPYRFEREHYEDRPYPVSGDYFTGPWGPLTGALNMTVGKVLKPQIQMHEEELAAGLASYAPVGDYGAYPTVGLAPGGSGGSGPQVASQLSSGNSQLAAAGRTPLGTAANTTASALGDINRGYAASAGSPLYGIPSDGGFTPEIISGAEPISSGSLGVQAGQIGYEAQELFGIYGFGFGAARSALGFGNQDMAPDRPVLQSAGKAYGSSRAFWDLNLGGLGDAPLPIEGPLSNLELSEMVRRFIPRERSDIQYVNPIPNTLAQTAPWLPGDDYFTNFKEGDPYVSVKEGELRLPGQGYERLHNLHPDETGQYGLVDKHKILGDVAPWSNQYREIDKMIGSGYGLAPQWMEEVETTREQVAAKTQKHEFTPYKYKYMDNKDAAGSPMDYLIGRGIEEFAHADSYFNTKFMPTRTAVEDWERNNVYGSTFPQWQHPISDFVAPLAHKSTQRNPIQSALVMGGIGALFGSTGRARMIGSAIGGAAGAMSSLYGTVYEAKTGDRFIPKERRKQIALEENIDILSYVKNMHLYNQAKMSGDTGAASEYKKAAQSTMYGADVHNATPEELARAIPKRKREHFRAMLDAPEQEREQILSTSGRLERRLLQGYWGQDVEKRPELEDYFQNRELPDENWEGWHPNTNMEHVKVKMGQSLGIELSEMGYYPQQVREANLVNPSYPSMNQQESHSSVQQRIRQLLHQRGLQGDVYPVHTPYSGTRLEVQSGVY